MNFQLAKYSLLKKFSENIGFTTLEEYGAIFKYLIENVKTDRQIIYSPHCHDDLGMAVANSLAAVKNGAGRVEGTINGIRERAGNAALEEIAVALNIRQDYYQVETSIVLNETINTSEMVSRFSGIPVPKNKAVVGGNTFSHESGIHQDGVLKNPLTYEIITPELVGVKIFESLKHLSPLKSERIAGVDFVIVRELTGGIYFGDHILEERKARDINDYSYEEVERIIRKAFEIARNRRKIVTSIDKQNVLATSKLWRKVAEEVAQDFPDVTLEHQLVDSAAMLMITNPAKFDVIVTENLFGDILSDESSVLSGTLGVMPSASHSENGPSLYEPIHGSVPDIAGQGIANPISMILSVSMMLRDSFGGYEDAERIKRAVETSLAAGILTRDIGGQASTKEMTEAIIARL